jgi:hypothetical protein
LEEACVNHFLDLEAAAADAGRSYATVRRWAKAGALVTYGARPRMAFTDDVRRVSAEMTTRRLANLALRRTNEQ